MTPNIVLSVDNNYGGKTSIQVAPKVTRYPSNKEKRDVQGEVSMKYLLIQPL